MARIDIHNHALVVHIEGFDRIRAMRRMIAVPLEHVASVDLHPNLALRVEAGASIRGTHEPGHLYEGTFPTPEGDGVMFCDVHHPERAFSIELREEPYKRLVLEVPNEAPEQVKARIESALS